MKLKVDKDLCIMCGACAGIASDVFELEEDGAHCILDTVPENLIEDAKDALDNCPTSAIKEVEEDK